jgi:hypothetical protein
MINLCLYTRRAAAFCALVFVISLAARQASAQVNGNGWPPGSYTQTCTNLKADKGNTTNQNLWVLTAHCQNGQVNSSNKNIYVAASLKGAWACESGGSTIVNSYGVLECLPPAGSYQNSCSELYVTYPNLGLPPWLRQTVKTHIAVRCNKLDRQDHYPAF